MKFATLSFSGSDMALRNVYKGAGEAKEGIWL
jgi:hypothetical protein